MSDFASMGHTAMVRLLVRCAEKDLCLRGIPAQSAESKFNCEEISHNPKWGGGILQNKWIAPFKKCQCPSKQRGTAHTPGWRTPAQFDKVVTRGGQGFSLSPKAIN